MQFKELTFNDPNAQRIYANYINRVRTTVKVLGKENQQEILLEINSHIYEGTTVNTEGKPEVDQLLDLLEKLGQPELFLKPLVADKQLDEAVKTFNPLKIAKALILNIGNGISYIVFAILYLFLFSFLFLIVAKLVNPDNVGLFYNPGKVFILGLYKDANGVSYTQYEQLGNWFIPLMVLSAVVLYIILTLLLRLKRKLTTIARQH